MQNVQNAAEIQQRVINLVELYRTKVGKESQVAKDAKAFYDKFEEMNRKTIDDGFLIQYSDIEGPDTEKWINHLMVNEQLLGHFYAKVAGKNAEKEVLDAFLPNYYENKVYTEDDENFLISHFKELVNYIRQTPCDEELEWVNRHDGRDAYVIPNEVLDLVKSRIDIPKGKSIYYPTPGFAQFTSLFAGCKFYFTSKSAWTKLIVYANDVEAEFVDEDSVSSPYDAVVLYLKDALNEEDPIGDGKKRKFVELFDNLKDGGRFILICPNEMLMSSIFEKNTFVEIIQLPQVMSSNTHNGYYSLLIIEKGRKDGMTTMIDARFACKKSEKTNFSQVLDLKSFDAMVKNQGCDIETGLRKKVCIPCKELRDDLLVPQVYVIDRPSDNDHPVPLSSLCQMVSEQVRDVKSDLPIDTPWIKQNDLSISFRGEIDITTLEKADCPNNPSDMNIHDLTGANQLGYYLSVNSCATEKEFRIANYRACTYMDGSSDAVLFSFDDDRIKTAIFRANGYPIVVDGDSFWNNTIYVLYPHKGIDALSLLSIIRMPIVYRQIQAYKRFGISNHLDNILVPTDKRIIHDEEQKLLNEGMIISELENNLKNIRKAVRMRKHALTQSLSSLEAMFYALNAFRERKDGQISDDDVISRVKGTTVRDAFEYLSKGLKGMMPVLEHIADVEYTFNKPEWIDPEIFIEDYIAKKEKGWLNFKPVITWKKGHNQAKTDVYAFTRNHEKEQVVKKGQSIDQFLFPKDALEHVLKNIVSNAQAWAFDDPSREDYQLKFSWYIKGNALIMEIENNGTPIPEDRNTESLLEYGVSTALHHDGHNGIGCNEIDDIMQRYDGNVEIVSTPQSTFTVKYVLTFNHTNDISKYAVIRPVEF